MTNKEYHEVLEMLDQAMKIAFDATVAMNNLASLPAFKHEGLPELLRAQMQNGYTLAMQSSRIWRAAAAANREP